MERTKKWIAVLCAALMTLGCQNTGEGGFSTADASNEDPCNLLMGGIVGGLLGALVDGNNRGRGALIGAGAGALLCVAFNAASRQTRSAEQVEADYKKRHGNKLPSEPVVEAYTVKVNDNVKQGEKANIVSTVTVVGGSKQPVNEVKEVLTIAGPEGTRTAEKKANERPESGTYENTFAVTFPKDIAPGTYPVSNKLYVNGKQVQERKQSLKVVAQADGLQFILIASSE